MIDSAIKMNVAHRIRQRIALGRYPVVFTVNQRGVTLGKLAHVSPLLAVLGQPPCIIGLRNAVVCAAPTVIFMRDITALALQQRANNIVEGHRLLKRLSFS